MKLKIVLFALLLSILACSDDYIPLVTETPLPTSTSTIEPTFTSTFEPTSTSTLEPTATSTVEPSPTPLPTGILYLSPIGTNNSICSINQPCATFSFVQSLSPNTIFMLPGNYTERIILSIDNITVFGQGARTNKPVLISGKNVSLFGVEVHSTNDIGIDITGTNALIDGVYVHDVLRHGIQARAQGVTVRNSTIERTVLENENGSLSSGFSSALKCALGGSQIIFSNNTLANNYGENIAITRCSDVQVIGNNTDGGIYAPSIYVDNSNYVVVANNTVVCSIGQRGGMLIGDENYSGSWGHQLYDIVFDRNSVTYCNNALAAWGNFTLKNIFISNNEFLFSINTSIYLEGPINNVRVEHNTIIQSQGKYIYPTNRIITQGNITGTSLLIE